MICDDAKYRPVTVRFSLLDIVEYSFYQERDLFNGVRCCAGSDGDPSELNVCAEGVAYHGVRKLFKFMRRRLC